MEKKTQISFFIIFICFVISACTFEKTNENKELTEEENENIVLKEHLLSKNKYRKGEALYNEKCASCHKKDGTGVIGTFPPLAKTESLNPMLAINAILHGIEGETIVNEEKYTTPMQKVELSNTETADLVNYILNSWGNQNGKVTPLDVEELR